MLALRQGFLSNIANPKMAIFFLSLLPQFVPVAGSIAALLPLGLVFCLMTFGWLSLYAGVLQRLRPIMQRSRVRRTLDAVSGTVLVALGIRVATEARA